MRNKYYIINLPGDSSTMGEGLLYDTCTHLNISTKCASIFQYSV